MTELKKLKKEAKEIKTEAMETAIYITRMAWEAGDRDCEKFARNAALSAAYIGDLYEEIEINEHHPATIINIIEEMKKEQDEIKDYTNKINKRIRSWAKEI